MAHVGCEPEGELICHLLVEYDMLMLRDLMTRDVIRLDPELTLRDALEILVARHISGAPVVDRGRIAGMFSAMDAIEFLATTTGGPDDADAQGEAELARVEDAQEGSTGAAAYFVDFWSNASADVAERLHDVNAAAWDLLPEHTVSEAMSRTMVALAPSADPRAAADAMQRAHAHRVLVMDGTRLVGIVSALDIARAVAQRRLESTRLVCTSRRRDFC